MIRFIAAIALVLGLLVLGTLPPHAITVDAAGEGPRPARGVLHVHTRRSDGGGTVADVAAAAARAGMQFVIVTDHGDGTREPDAPAYLDGVLVIDAVEVTTTDGHVLGLGLGQAPYRLGGTGADVVEDINRLGGFAIAAHVDSTKRSLTWRALDAALTGFEWLNADSEWRDESRWSLIGLLLPYAVRPVGALAKMLDRPEAALARWDEITRDRRLVTVAAADAHARMGGGDEDDARWWRRLSLPLPGYGPLFRTFSVSLTGVAFSGQPAEDADRVLSALRLGHSFTVVDALAGPAHLDFVATSGLHVATGGDGLPLAGPVRVQVRIPGPPEARIALIRNGVRVAEVEGTSLDREFAEEVAVYRVEVGLPGAPGTPPVPWMLSNPVFAGRGAGWGRPPSAQAGERAPAGRIMRTPRPEDWTVEHSTPSDAAVDVVTAGLARKETLFRYALSGPESAGPFAAAALPVDGLAGAGAVQLRLRSDRPMRVSVELRVAGPKGDERWRQSAYLDGTSRTVMLRPNDLRPAAGHTAALAMADTRSVLVVVDTVNTPSGTAGRIWIESVDVLAPAGHP